MRSRTRGAIRTGDLTPRSGYEIECPHPDVRRMGRRAGRVQPASKLSNMIVNETLRASLPLLLLIKG